MAYEMVKRLQQANEIITLEKLGSNVEAARKKNHKKHRVWELSFDWKACISIEFANQKLEYMHKNPCKGKWNLSAGMVDYKHSSAMFYTDGVQGVYPVTHIMEMQDLDLTKPGK